MTWQHQPKSGMLPNPGGYGSAYRTGVIPASNQPWMAGLSSFANTISQQMQQAKQFKQAQALAQIKADNAMTMQGVKGQQRIDQIGQQQAGALTRTKQQGTNQQNVQGMRNQEATSKTAMQYPKQTMMGIMSKYNLTGDATKDAATHGSALPQVKAQAENEFAGKLGTKGVSDPTYQALKSDQNFQKAIATGQPYAPPAGAGNVGGGNGPSNPAVPSITNPSLASGGTDNAPTYP